MNWTDAAIQVGIVVGVIMIDLVGLVLALLGLPGIWLILLAALGLELWQPDLLNWWTIGGGLGLALTAELVEFFAGSAGSKVAGGTRRAGIGAIIGGIVGAIAGAAFPPVLGAIIWGAVGAGLGAIIGEIGANDRPVREMFHIGGAAAAGKLIGTLIKGFVALVVGIWILVDVLF